MRQHVDRLAAEYIAILEIHAAFTGRIGKDAEVRTDRGGMPWASFLWRLGAKADGEAPATWVRVALFGDVVAALAPRLTKGSEVYCEGRLALGTWTGGNGEARAGLNLAAWEVQPMGHIGRRKPKARSCDEYGAVPFDDELRF
jgi:single-stranded DNA-binding protein